MKEMFKKNKMKKIFKKNNRRGSITVESAMAVPFLLLFVIFMLEFELKLFEGVENYTEGIEYSSPDYSDISRKVSVIFDAGGNIYELLFGE